MVVFDFIAKNLGVSMMAVSLILVAFHGRELMKWAGVLGTVMRAGLLFVALLGVANAAGVIDLAVHADRAVALAFDLANGAGEIYTDTLG